MDIKDLGIAAALRTEAGMQLRQYSFRRLPEAAKGCGSIPVKIAVDRI